MCQGATEGVCNVQPLHWQSPETKPKPITLKTNSENTGRVQAHGAACAAVYELLRGAVALHARLAGFLGQLRAGGFLQCSLASLAAVRRPQKHAVRYVSLIEVARGMAWHGWTQGAPDWAAHTAPQLCIGAWLVTKGCWSNPKP